MIGTRRRLRLLSRALPFCSVLLVALGGCGSSNIANPITLSTNTSITGSWTSSLNFNNVAHTIALTFVQTGGTITGSGTISDETGVHDLAVTSGTISNNALALDLGYTASGSVPVRLVISASVATTRLINGIVTVTVLPTPPPNIPITLTKSS